MKILIIYRTEKDSVGRSVKEMAEKLIKSGHEVDLVSRNDDLNLQTLSGSMDALKGFIIREDQKEKYDIVYTQDWSIAFPLVFPSKILFEKHYSLFHDVEPSGAQSKVMQKITGNLMGNHLFVKTEELKKKFSSSKISKDGLDVLKPSP